MSETSQGWHGCNDEAIFFFFNGKFDLPLSALKLPSIYEEGHGRLTLSKVCFFLI